MALPEAALYWPAQRALLVADLHFEKASWYARFGQFLPPHDSQATLDVIETLVERTGAALHSVADRIVGVDAAANRIAESLREQARDLAAVNGEVAEIERFTRENLTVVSQARAADEALAGQGARLMSLVGRFRLGRGVARRAA